MPEASVTAPGAAERLHDKTVPPVVVLNTHYSGLAIARDLAPLGIRVIGVTAEPSFPGNRSRWLEYRASPDSSLQPGALMDFLQRLAVELGQRAVLFPTRDHDLNFINSYRARLDQHYIVPFPSTEVIERTLDKEACARAAQRCGILTPASVFVRSSAEIESARGLRFPCVCKPVQASQWRRPDMWDRVGRQKAIGVETYEDLQSAYQRFAELDPTVIVQERIPGPERNLQIFGSVHAPGGDCLGYFTARKLLQYPPLLGTGLVVEAEPISSIVEPSMRLLKELEYFGISEVEFKVDERTGDSYLIEVNPRHWDQHGLGTAVGVNLSEAIYRSAIGAPSKRMLQGAAAVRWIGEPDFALHMARSLFGEVSVRELWSLTRGKRCLAILDRGDWRPGFAAVGSVSAQLLAAASAKVGFRSTRFRRG